MRDAAKSALTQCLNLQSTESCLILTDNTRLSIANAFYKEAKNITDKVKLIEIPELEYNGREPDDNAAQEMLDYDVILIITSKSMSHTKARRQATENGARLASMPGITEDMAKRTLSADYKKIRERTQHLVKLLTKANTLRVTTELGTDITMDISNLKCSGADAGIFDKPGAWGNLPEGEACMAPKENTTNGIFIVNKTMAGVGKLQYPIKFTVRDGFVADITGAEEAARLKKLLMDFNDPSVYNIAEIGIGTNDKAIITGITLEDEKVLGTAHIAIGNNLTYDGGTTNAPVHLDGVFSKPNIYLDDKLIIEKGVLKG